MSISLNANFELLSAGLYLDARQQFNTIIEMKDFAETSIPDGFITYNKETQMHYVFNSSNTVDATLGKWREYNSGNSSSITYPTWNSNVDYKVGNVVLKDEVRYSCIADHTSTDFETDSINWVVVLEQYYHVTQEQYNKMVSDGLIADTTKDLYIIDGNNEDDNSTHKTVIFENNIDMGKYLLLAKITGANYSNNIIKFSCPNYKGVNDAGFKYENDMDIYKFELHFNTGSRKEINSYGVTLKQHGLGLYSYPLSNPKNTEPRLEEAIRLYWDYSKGDIYVFLVDIMTAIPHCVLEYTGSGILLRENTFVMDDLYNRRDGLNGTWAESKWKSIPYNKLEIPQIYELGGGSTEGVKTYTSLSQLGLTAPVTVSEIFNAMADDTMAILACEDIADYITDVPMSYGVLTIKKKNSSRFSIDYQNSLGGSATNVKRWIGTLKGTDGTGLYWKELQGSTGAIITTDTIAKYGTEILKYPIGTWRIDSTNIGKQFTDLPYSEMAGIIEIDSIQPNKSPYEHVYGYRNYTFRDALNNTVYTRSLNSGNTVGTINRDSGWCTTGSHIYKLSQMYLSARATIQEVIDKVPIGSTAILRTDEFTDWSTLFNGIQYGYFKVEKTVNGLSNIELQEVVVPNRRYFGTQSSGKFSAWIQMITEDSKTDPYSCYGYTALTGTEDLFTLPCGHYVSANINTAYNYPITDSSNTTAHIYVLGCLNEPANNKGYRIILYFDNKNRMYRINEWWGSFGNGWQNMQVSGGNGGSSDVYSTSEQAIGTWVDGKTIYRKTIVKDSHGVNGQLISGVDTFIRGYGTCERAGYVYNVPHCGLLAGHLQDEDVPYLNFKLDTNGALSTIGSSTYTISKLKVTLEYTKK